MWQQQLTTDGSFTRIRLLSYNVISFQYLHEYLIRIRFSKDILEFLRELKYRRINQLVVKILKFEYILL